MSIASFREVGEGRDINFADCQLGKSLDVKASDKPMSEYDKPLGIAILFYFPRDGRWAGTKGDSDWQPEPEKKPIPKGPDGGTYNNPDGLTWDEIFKKYGIEKITFKDGYPDFGEISRGTVEIDDFSESRADNFLQADEQLANEKNCSPEEVAQWRKENGYTWHECEDCRTMQKVPHEVHANTPHKGGISVSKNSTEGQQV